MTRTAIRIFIASIRHSIGAALLLFVLAMTAGAQITRTLTEGQTPPGIAPGAPAGSYALSGFDNVNLFNGNLNFLLPLVKVGGRGESGYTMTLPIEQRWRVDKEYLCPPDNCPTAPTENPIPTWWQGLPRGLSPGTLIGRYATDFSQVCPGFGTPQGPLRALTRLTFTEPDGTEYELRDQLTGGQPWQNLNACNVPAQSGALRGKVFVSADGTAMTFISDADITDTFFALDSSTEFYPSGYLMLRDGTRYRVDQGLVTSMRDRNGNLLQFTYEPPGGYNRLIKVIDSLNRQITISYADLVNTFYDEIDFSGFQGVSRHIRIWHDTLEHRLRSVDFPAPAKTYKQLFLDMNVTFTGPHNPDVVSAVELPDGRQYQLYYNYYGEVARVVLPTGGAFEYDFGSYNGSESGFTGDAMIYRRLIERRVYPNGGNGASFEGKTVYSTNSVGNLTVTVDHLDHNLALLAREKHYFFSSPLASASEGPTIYPAWNEGRENQTEALDTDGLTVLRRAVNTWQQRAPVGWSDNTQTVDPPNDPRLVETMTTLEPATANQVSKQTALNPINGAPGFDQYNNRTDLWEYDFGSGAPGVLLSHTHTDFVTTNNGVDYAANTSIHIRDLPLNVTIDGGGAPLALTSYAYDSYPNGLLTDRRNISGHDSTFAKDYTKRGNPTSITKGIGADATTTSLLYDIAGNVVSVTDGRGYTTTADYADDFSPSGPLDASPPANNAPSGLGGQVSFAFPTSIKNPLGHTALNQYDYSTGYRVKQQDPNLVIATLDYSNDALDRPTRLVRAINHTEAETQSRIVYEDTAHTVSTTSDLDGYNDNQLVSSAIYDGLGRTFKTIKTSPEGGIATFQTFDGMGRPSRTYNPYKSAADPSPPPSTSTDPTFGWTDTTYDTLSRVTKVETFDNNGNSTGFVQTNFSGNTETVTDQAGKVRNGTTDALGRLVKVIEDPSGKNYQTTYSYDPMGNLITVTQGGQTRTFGYDSLSRLKSAQNPEQVNTSGVQVATQYTYDANSNLRTKIDPNGVTTTYTLDALNRVIDRTYTDGTPEVKYDYDAPGVGLGRLHSVTTMGVSVYQYTAYDALNRPTAYNQQTGGATYAMSCVYDAAGLMTDEHYPNESMVVHTEYDTAGRVAGVKDQGSGTYYAGGPRSSSTAMQYTPQGSITQMTLGNGLTEVTGYNSRMQPTKIQLGNTNGPSDVLELGYDYGGAANNGNVRQQTINIGSQEVGTQAYNYDGLNRILTAQETLGLTPVWSQNFDYDQFGNMAITHSDIPLNPLAPLNVSVAFDPATNRLRSSNYDNNGNQKKDGQASIFGYDSENRMTSCTVNGVNSQYTYDGEGRRVTKPAPTGGTTTTFVYNAGGQLLAEYNGPVGNGGISYLTTDHLGSTRVVTAGSGSRLPKGGVLARYDYQPFGDYIPVNIGNRLRSFPEYGTSEDTRQKFTSKERDPESNLDYFGARYYSFPQGRFASSDPLLSTGTVYDPQTWNRYSYTLNNPLRYTDPLGLWVYDSSVTDDQKKKFEKALQNLAKARDHFQKGSTEYNRIDRALKAYGDKGVDNGVTVKFATNQDGAPGATSPGIKSDATGKKATTANNPTGQNTVVAIDPGRNRNDNEYAFTVGHEGSHVADIEDLVGALPTDLTSPQAQTVLADPTKNLFKWATEVSAYETESFIGQALAPGGPNLTQNLSVGGTRKFEIWNSGWSQAERAQKRSLGIFRVLTQPKSQGGLYALNPVRHYLGKRLIQ